MLLQLYRSYLFYKFRQINRLVDTNAICDGMCLFDQLRQMLVPDDLVILKSTKNGIVGTKAIKATAENAFIQKFILAKKVQRAVCDGCAC